MESKSGSDLYIVVDVEVIAADIALVLQFLFVLVLQIDVLEYGIFVAKEKTFAGGDGLVIDDWFGARVANLAQWEREVHGVVRSGGQIPTFQDGKNLGHIFRCFSKVYNI